MATNSSSNIVTAASGKVLQGQGVGVASAFSTATYPATTTINQLLYSSSANTVAGLTTANSAFVTTTSGGIPQCATSPSCSGTITAGTGVTATTGNVAITAGNLTLPNTNSGGSQGTIQLNSLPFMSNFGTASTFLGSAAGNASNTGSYNTGLGFNALTAISSGQANTCVGRLAGGAISTTSDNTVMGNAAFYVGTGSRNTLIGSNVGSAFNVLSGADNAVIGYNGVTSLTTGTFNCAMGTNAMSNLITGSYNVGFGNAVGSAYSGAESSNILISNAGVNAESNVIRIGTQGTGNSQQNACYIAGIAGVTTANTQVVTINTSTGQLGAAPGTGGIITVTGALTNAQIKALHGTPVAAIAAQGAGKVIQVISASAKMVYGGTNVFTAGASQTINLYYGTTTSIDVVLTNAEIVASATQFNGVNGISTFGGANTGFDNVAVNLYNPIATEITGNAANNNTVTWSITYQVIAI
jgi:hypothetical protein